MPYKLSFKDIVEAHYYDELCEAVASYVKEDVNRLERSAYSVDSPDDVELSDLHIKSTSVCDAGGIGIKFDVAVEAEFEIAETVNRYRESDDAAQWFCISCTADLDNGLHNFAINDISVYSRNKFKQDALSDALVPYIGSENLEKEAEAFLRKYYPEALGAPKPVPVLEVARRMGLTVKPVHLSENASVFGQLHFEIGETEQYNHATGKYEPLLVEKDTIFYDPNVFFMRNLGSVHNTIIHECVHYDKHKKAFELRKLFSDGVSTIRCNVVEGSKPESKRSPTDWMEWQANHLAPRILMPIKQAAIRARELIQMNMLVMQTDKISDVMETVIVEMAEFFGVSKIAAKIRMIDLGYEDAFGTLTYIDGRYVKNHTFAKGTLKRNQTFVIGVQDALFEYASNPDLRSMVDSGKYIYVESRYCINDPKYIQTNDNGQPELTDYANRHADECCLVFDIEVKPNANIDSKYYTECVLYHDVSTNNLVEAKYKNSDQNKAVDARADGSLTFDVYGTGKTLRSLPSTFTETLKFHMERLKLTEEKLSEAALVAPKTIQRMRNNENYNHKLKTLVAICIGLKLNIVLSEDLIKKSGLSFKPTDEHIIYKWLLGACYKNDIYECNEILEQHGFEPIGREE